jgi:hypothetical protein
VHYSDRSLEAERQALEAAGLAPDLARLSAEFFTLAPGGLLAAVSPAVEALTGRPPRRFEQFLADYRDRF